MKKKEERREKTSTPTSSEIEPAHPNNYSVILAYKQETGIYSRINFCRDIEINEE